LKKPFENKSAYDPGRFRYPVTFLQQIVNIQADGSQIVSYSVALVTRAVRERVTRRFNVLGDMSFEAGAALMQNYWYFIVRFRSGFTPLKDMVFMTPDGVYTVNAVPELDEPANYWRMLCVKTDQIITT
jgi:hypothetical protein